METSEALRTLFAIVITISYPIAFLIIGVKNLDNECNRNAGIPTLALYLVVQNSVTLFHLVVIVLNCYSRGALTYYSGILLLIILMFDLAWSIVGAIRISQDEFCKEESPTYWMAALACMVLCFLMLPQAKTVDYMMMIQLFKNKLYF